MVYGDVKIKERTSRILGYAIIIIGIVVLLHILNPSIVSPVPRFVISKMSSHPKHFSADEKRMITFDEGIETIHAKYAVKKTIEKILENNESIVTVFIKHADEDTYIIAFSNGLLYNLRVEIQKKEGKKREVITDSRLQLSTTPINSIWYRSSIIVLATDDKGNTFLHILKRSKRKNSLHLTKTIQVPFAMQSKDLLYANDSAVFLYAYNTVYILEKNTLRVYEKNVCSLSSVVANESFAMLKILSSTDGISCTSASAYLNTSYAYKDYALLHTTENRIRIFSVNSEWNLFPLPQALATLGTVDFHSTKNDYQRYENQENHYKFFYAYGDKNYTITLQ